MRLERQAERLNIDHAIPFRWWGINDLWNLLPADKAVNSAKSDAIPSPALIEKRADVILGYWEGLRRARPVQFEAQFRDSLVGGNGEASLRAGINALLRKSEYLISVRGCTAWTL